MEAEGPSADEWQLKQQVSENRGGSHDKSPTECALALFLVTFRRQKIKLMILLMNRPPAAPTATAQSLAGLYADDPRLPQAPRGCRRRLTGLRGA